MIHTVWFHLYEILGKENYSHRKQTSGCQGLKEETDCKGLGRTFQDDGNVLYQGSVNVFCKGTDGKLFRLCRVIWSLSQLVDSAFECKNHHRRYVQEWTWLPLYLDNESWILCDFHMLQNIALLIFFWPLKNININLISSSRPVQK